MDKPLRAKIREAIRWLRLTWRSLPNSHRFVAFSTGKDSLALAALLYEAVDGERPACLYVHHDLEFPSNLDYVFDIRERGYSIQILRPHLGYFELMERGMGFIRLKEPWCIPLLIGTGLVDWVKQQGASSCREAVMFRGISASEYSCGMHSRVELYKRLDMPCINPMLSFTRQEILAILRIRYALPLNPIYEHMDRSYCICCYTSDARRQAYSKRNYPAVYAKYYEQIEELLFRTGLIYKAGSCAKYKTRHEKLEKHGFAHWRRIPAQRRIGAVKRRFASGAVVYTFREAHRINTKHLAPLRGKCYCDDRELRFWDTPERHSDAVVRRMLNCVDCGFCMVECMSSRRFDREAKKLRIEGCTQCGKCLRVESCMGWKHRFWQEEIACEPHGG